MATRHVLMRPPLDVGQPRQGLVVSWRKRPSTGPSPPFWEAFVAHVDERTGDLRVEWVPAVYLQPIPTG